MIDTTLFFDPANAGNIIALIVSVLGVIGAIYNTSLVTKSRHTGYLIWVIANGISMVLYIMAYLGLLIINLGFLFLAGMYAVYFFIALIGVRNNKERLE